ncbi:MAG: hypothetical protein IPM54_25200 [Polyangiaceae bacterium]|nr:hypothetical protein [Polyangiaceae bacterium]
MTRNKNYERQLRHNGPQAKAVRETLRKLLDLRISEYLAYYEEANSPSRTRLEVSVECDVAIDALVRAHAGHVVFTSDLLEEVKRLANHMKSTATKGIMHRLLKTIEKRGAS